MLNNIYPATDLQGLARRRSRRDEFKTVRHVLVHEELANGWTEVRKNRTTTRLMRPKRQAILLEDRVWTLMYQMGFNFLSGQGGSTLTAKGDESGPSNQLD